MNRIICAASLLGLLMASPAVALNAVSASNNGVGWFPYAWQFGSQTFDDFQTAMTQQATTSATRRTRATLPAPTAGLRS